MSAATSPVTLSPEELREHSDEAVALVRRWLVEARDIAPDTAGTQLAGVLEDPNGLDFTVGFVDGVARPEDLRVAAANLKAIAPLTPTFLPWYMRAAIRVGGVMAPVMPGIVVPISRRVLRHMVRHLVVDASDHRLGASIRRIRGEADSGIKLNVNLLGEAILGEHEAARRLEGTRRLLARDDVDYVSIKVSSTVAPHSEWAFDEAVEHVVETLTPLYRLAATATDGAKFINLDMEEYKDLDLTIAVFTSILDREEFRSLSAGIVLQAYLPDALSAMIRLQEWSASRVAAGGAPIKVRLVKGANLPMESVDADIHGWPLATWHSKQASDSSYKAVLDYALHPERVANVRVGVAGHNLFDIALAWLLAQSRGAEHGIEFEMLLGMATAQAAVVKKEVGSLLLYTPVVHPGEFDVAIAYLVRRLEEGASRDNFMSAVFSLDDDPALFDRERQRFLDSIDGIIRDVPGPNRTQDRTAPATPAAREGFTNTPDTDPSLAPNRAWGRAIIERMQHSELGTATVEAGTLTSVDQLDAVVAGAASSSWAKLSADERAEILHRAGDRLEARRAQLLEVMGSECGKTIDQGDPEVSEAIDFAHYYAEQGRQLDAVDGASFASSRVIVVTPPWNFPVAIPAGSTLAALASGASVIIKPARQARRSGAVMVEALWEAGVPADALSYVQLAERSLGERLVAHEAVDSVILTGGYETAELFRGFRQDLPLFAETSGKNAIIVTPSADLDLAAKDIVASAFGHAGQKCSAASLVVLVGTVADSRRLLGQIKDATQSLPVGHPWQPESRMGPIIGPAEGKLLDGLTRLGDGEEWMLEPEQLDDSGKLWSPGIRTGVARGSEYHLTEYFGPILGIMVADSLEEAVDIVNDIDYGLTSGLHSLNPEEIGYWIEHVEAGNLYVNRGITGAIVQRQPFGGWKKSAVGTGTKAGGPNYVGTLGHWSDAAATSSAKLDQIAGRVLDAAQQSGVDSDAIAWLESALRTDVDAWADEFGAAKDVTGLSYERNVFRYRPVDVIVRDEGAPLAELLRVAAAGIRAGSGLRVSATAELAAPAQRMLDAAGVTVTVDTADAWLAEVATMADTPTRIRLLGADRSAIAAATDGSPTVAVHDGAVLRAGRIEMLPFLREQAVSITAHRFGSPNHLSDGLI